MYQNLLIYISTNRGKDLITIDNFGERIGTVEKIYLKISKLHYFLV